MTVDNVAQAGNEPFQPTSLFSQEGAPVPEANPEAVLQIEKLLEMRSLLRVRQFVLKIGDLNFGNVLSLGRDKPRRQVAGAGLLN